MSDTSKSKPNNVLDYIVYGVDEKLQIKETTKNEQSINIEDIPGIPMEISVDTHTCEIAPNGEIIRKAEDGTLIPGKVNNKKVKEALQGKQQSER